MQRIELNLAEMETVLERARREPLPEADYQKLKAAVETLGHLTRLLEDKQTTIGRLRQLLFGSRTEKTRQVLKNPSDPSRGRRSSAPGHGRNGAAAYAGARRISVRHSSLQPGDRCPGCGKGKVYGQQDPGVLIRVVGQAPLAATVHELQKLRCHLCGEVFTAAAPEGVGEKKYDETAASMIALLNYGSGVPFYRLQGLEESLAMPLPVATQWEIVARAAAVIRPALEELIRQAAQGEVLHNDDTHMKVLALTAQEPAESATQGSGDGRGRKSMMLSRRGCSGLRPEPRRGCAPTTPAETLKPLPMKANRKHPPPSRWSGQGITRQKGAEEKNLPEPAAVG